MKVLLNLPKVKKLIIALASTPEEWETEIKARPGFSKIEKSVNGVMTALDQDGQVIDVYAPESAKRKMPVTEKNMEYDDEKPEPHVPENHSKDKTGAKNPQVITIPPPPIPTPV